MKKINISFFNKVVDALRAQRNLTGGGLGGWREAMDEGRKGTG